MNKYRTEKDNMGEVKVPAERLWGAQTQRSLENFCIGSEKMPSQVIKALALIKISAARVNASQGLLKQSAADAIEKACSKIVAGELDDEFPLLVWQTGSGTQTNMNVNEVIAHLSGLHPNDDVNKGQSSNDTFPSAMSMAIFLETKENLIPALEQMAAILGKLKDENKDVIKLGRTHLQDATPLTLGQEISAWEEMIMKSIKRIEGFLPEFTELPLGGTAVGTGLNSCDGFGRLAATEISKLTGYQFIESKNKFYELTSKDKAVAFHGILKSLASDLMKIANDVRLLASGPRGGIGEIKIPENEPGSSIMPGKVNPTQCEAMTMVCTQVMGNDVAIGIAASQGHFQLNTFMPVIIYNTLQSITLLSDASKSFTTRCLDGITADVSKIREHLEDSLMLITCLTPIIGYDNASAIAKAAFQNGTTIREEALKSGFVDEKTFDENVKPEKMI